MLVETHANWIEQLLASNCLNIKQTKKYIQEGLIKGISIPHVDSQAQQELLLPDQMKMTPITNNAEIDQLCNSNQF